MVATVEFGETDLLIAQGSVGGAATSVGETAAGAGGGVLAGFGLLTVVCGEGDDVDATGVVATVLSPGEFCCWSKVVSDPGRAEPFSFPALSDWTWSVLCRALLSALPFITVRPTAAMMTKTKTRIRIIWAKPFWLARAAAGRLRCFIV